MFWTGLWTGYGLGIIDGLIVGALVVSFLGEKTQRKVRDITVWVKEYIKKGLK